MTSARQLRIQGTSIRIGICLVYAGLVVWGFSRLCKPSPSLEQAYVVQGSNLPVGHLVRKGDLKINPDLPPHLRASLLNAPPEDHYLTEGHPAISAAALTDTPRLRANTGDLIVPFALASELSSCLDVDGRVRIFGGANEVPGVRVAAIVCPKPSAQCTALLDVTPDEAKLLGNLRAPTEYRLALETPIACAAQQNQVNATPKNPATR